jgi:hypothetical protein
MTTGNTYLDKGGCPIALMHGLNEDNTLIRCAGFSRGSLGRLLKINNSVLIIR